MDMMKCIKNSFSGMYSKICRPKSHKPIHLPIYIHTKEAKTQQEARQIIAKLFKGDIEDSTEIYYYLPPENEEKKQSFLLSY